MDNAPLEVSISELARLKNVSKQSIAKRVERYVQMGALSTRYEGKTRLVPLAEFDQLCEETTDFSKVRGTPAAPGVIRKGSTAEDPILVQEQARRARYDADLKEIELKRQLAEVLLASDVANAMALCAERLVREIDRLPTRADDIAAAVGTAGVDGARRVLKEVARSMRERLAAAMRITATETADDGPDEV